VKGDAGRACEVDAVTIPKRLIGKLHKPFSSELGYACLDGLASAWLRFAVNPSRTRADIHDGPELSSNQRSDSGRAHFIAPLLYLI
jgi:hypothetical protein